MKLKIGIRTVRPLTIFKYEQVNFKKKEGLWHVSMYGITFGLLEYIDNEQKDLLPESGEFNGIIRKKATADEELIIYTEITML